MRDKPNSVEGGRKLRFGRRLAPQGGEPGGSP